MVILALGLIIVGLACSLLGYKLFKILLPIGGVVTGAIVGFTGFQSIFGTGITSTVIAVLAAIIIGLVIGVLSYAFLETAVIVLAGLATASLFSFFGVALGLSSQGFLVFLFGVAGFAVGFIAASALPVSTALVTYITSILGVGITLAGVFLLSGKVSFDDLQNNGVINSVVSVVDHSIIWLMVWIAASVISTRIQVSMAYVKLLGDEYQFEAKKQ